MAILVINKNPDIFWFIKNCITDYELELTHIEDVNNALEIIERNPPKLIIMQDQLGKKYLDQIKKSPISFNVKVICFTFNYSYGFKKEFIEAQCDQLLFHESNKLPTKEITRSLVAFYGTEYDGNNLPFNLDSRSVKTKASLKLPIKVRWISLHQCAIETDLKLSVGNQFYLEHESFEVMGLPNCKCEVESIDYNGCFYSLHHYVICKITFEDDKEEIERQLNKLTRQLADFKAEVEQRQFTIKGNNELIKEIAGNDVKKLERDNKHERNMISNLNSQIIKCDTQLKRLQKHFETKQRKSTPVLERLGFWIKDNFDYHVSKEVKAVFFESQYLGRKYIENTFTKNENFFIKIYHVFKNVKDILERENPDFICINRSFAVDENDEFEDIKSYLKRNNIICVTYQDKNDAKDYEKFIENNPFAVHAKDMLTASILEQMATKVELKKKKPEPPVGYFSDHTVYTNAKIRFSTMIAEFSSNHFSVISPIGVHLNAAFELESSLFNLIGISSNQYFRVIRSKTYSSDEGIDQYLILGNYYGLTIPDSVKIDDAITLIDRIGVKSWASELFLAEDSEPEQD